MAKKKKEDENKPRSWNSGYSTVSFDPTIYEDYTQGTKAKKSAYGWGSYEPPKTEQNKPFTVSGGHTSVTFDPSLYKKYYSDAKAPSTPSTLDLSSVNWDTTSSSDIDKWIKSGNIDYSTVNLGAVKSAIDRKKAKNIEDVNLNDLYTRAEGQQRYAGYEKTVADWDTKFQSDPELSRQVDAFLYAQPEQTNSPSADWDWNPDAPASTGNWDINPDDTYSAQWERAREQAFEPLKAKGYTQEEVLAYYDAKTRLENREKTTQEVQRAQEEAAKGGWSAAWATAKNVPKRLLGGPAGALRATFQQMNGDPVDWYDPYQSWGLQAKASTEQIVSDIDNPVWSTAYQLGNSALDMAAVAGLSAIGVPPIIGTSLMGGSAAQQAMFEAKERNISDADAVGTGIAAGVFETLFERVSLEMLLKPKAIDAKTFGGKIAQVFRNIGIQGFTEGSEEVFTSIANEVFDRWTNGGKSEYETNVRNYMASGMSADEARRAASSDFAKSLALDFGGGALLGGVLGGGKTAIDTALTTKQYGNVYGGSNLQDTINEALETDSGNTFAQAAQERANAGKKVSSGNVRAMVETMAETQQTQDTERVTSAVKDELIRRGVDAETAETEASAIAKTWAGEQVNPARERGNLGADQRFVLTSDEQNAIDNSENAEEILSDLRSREGTGGWADSIENKQLKTGRQQTRDYNRMVESVTRSYLDSQDTAALTEEDTSALEKRFGRAGAEAFVKMKTAEDNDGIYYHAFNTAYLYGENGVSLEKTVEAVGNRVSKGVVEAAYAAGKGKAEFNLQNTAKNQMAKLTGVRNKTPGRVNITANQDGLSATQWASINAMRAFSTVTGINVNVVEGGTDANGNFVTENGSFNEKTNTVTIDINAGRANINDALSPVMMKTLGHEVTHFIQNNNAEGYDSLKKFVAKTLADKGMNLEALARKRMALDEKDRQSNPNRKGEEPMTYEQAIDEVVADACEDMLQNTEAIDRLAREDWNLFKQIRNWIRNWVRSIKRAFEAGGISHEESVAMLDKADELQKLWDDAFVRAVENYQQTVDGRDAVEMQSNGETVAVNDGNGHVQASMRTYRDGGRAQLKQYLEQRAKEGAITEEEAQDMVSQMDEMYDLCQQFADEFGLFGQWSEAEVRVDPKTGKPIFSVVKANGEYAMNLDFSLVCKKRRTLDAVFEQMINDGIMEDFDMTEASIAAINDIIRDNGFETACALCFVDSKRYRQGIVADAFVGMYNELVRSMIKEGQHADAFNFGGNSLIVNDGKGIDTLQDSDLDFTRINEVLKTEGEKTVLYKIAKDLKENPADRKLLMRGDFMSAKAFDNVKATNERVMGLYNSKKGAGGPKAASLDVQYLSEILTQKKFNPAKAYSVGGVRIQSFSDYMPRLVFDYMQMIADLSAKQLPAHAYTKEPLFVLQFGLSGIKSNMSLVPEVVEGGVAPGLDKDGNYAWRDGQSFGSTVYGGSKAFIQKCYEIIGKQYNGQDRLTAAEGYELAKAIQNAPGYGVNCGTIAVGVSNEHIEKLLRDPNIRMVIPYHKSSLNHIVAVMTNIDKYHDYTGVQNTRRADGTKLTKRQKDFNYNDALRRLGDAKAAADEYLAWCDKKGYLPKFDRFRKEEGYYKLLEDFATYDMDGNATPQGAVTLTLPGEDSAFGSMSELMRMGLEEDALLQAKQDAAVPEMVKQIQKVLPGFEAAQREGKTKYSARDSEYMELAKDPEKNAARLQEMVDEAAEAAGLYRRGAGEEINIYIPDGKMRKDGSSVSFIDMILDGEKLGETRGLNTHFPVGRWLGIAKNGQVVGRVKFGPAKEITRSSPEYADAKIAGTNYDIEPGQKKLYYPIVDMMDLRDNPREVIRNGNYGTYQFKSADPVTYDNSGKVIPLSERFNTEKDDIRYSTRDVEYLELAKDPEKNAARLQEMVDEAAKAAGYDVKAYHGTPGARFNVFDSRYSDDNLSFFFTSDDKIAKGYANAREQHGTIIPVYINTSNLLHVDAKGGRSYTDIPYDSISEYDIRVNRNEKGKYPFISYDYSLYMYNRGTGETTEYAGKYEDVVSKLEKVFGKRQAKGLIDESVWHDETIRIAWDSENMEEVPNSSVSYGKRAGTSDTRSIAKDAKRKGYDGVAFYNLVDTAGWDETASTIYALFDNTKIKSADPVTYDDSGKVIPLSERFNTENKDIRYSTRDNTDISSRELLANALESVAQDEAERDILKNYQAKVAKLNEIQQKLNEQRALMRDHINGTHKLTGEELRQERERAKIYADQLNRADKALLRLENMGPVKTMLEREHAAYRKALKNNERLTRYNERLTQRIEEAKQSKRDYIERRRETDTRRKYRERIKKTANDFRQMILHPTDTRYAPSELMAGCYEVALMLDTSGEREDTKSKAKFREQMLRIERQYNALKNSEDSDYRLEYDSDFEYMVQQLNNRLQGKAVRDLTVTELEDVSNVLTDIYNMLRDAKKQIGKADSVTNYSVGERIVRQQTEYNARSRSGAQKAIAGMMRLTANPIRNARRMSGYDNDAAIYQLVEDINKGVRKKNRFTMEANQMFDRFSGKRLRDSDTKLKTYTLGGEEVQMTEQQAMQVILSWEREAINGITHHMTSGGILLPNQAQMKKGNGGEAIRTGQNVNGITEEEITEMYRSMDDWAKDYMDVARSFFNGMAQKAINEATMQTKHRRVATTEAYIPFEIDSNTVAQEIEGVKYDATIEGMGMLKSIQEGAANALIMRGLNTIVQRHIDKVGQVYGLAVPIKNYNKAMAVKMLGSSRVASAALNDADRQLLDQAVTDLQTPRKVDRNAVSRFMNKMQSAFVKATLLSNVSVTIKQAASYSTAGLYLSQQALFPYQATVAALFANNKSKMARDLFAEIDAHTAAHYIRRQGMSMAEAATVAQDNGPVTRWMDENIKADALNPLKWIQNMDVATTAALWLATKRQVELDGVKPTDENYWAKVTDLYEKVIEDTQPNYDVLHRPEIQRTTNQLTRAVVMFQTQPLQNAGIVWDSIGNYYAAKQRGTGVKEARLQLARAVGSQIASLAVFASMSFLAYAAKNRLGRYKDDEEELTVESVLKRIFGDMAANSVNLAIPAFGSTVEGAIEHIVSKAKGDRAYDVMSVPAVDMFNDWIDMVGGLVKDFSDLDDSKDKVGKDIHKFAMKTSGLFGIPAENVYNLFRGTVGNVGDTIGAPVDWATDEQHTSAGMKAAWENGHYDSAKQKLDDLIEEKIKGGMTEKDAKTSLKSTMTSTYKPMYLKALRDGDKAEIFRIQKILTLCGLYDDVLETLQNWQKN